MYNPYNKIRKIKYPEDHSHSQFMQDRSKSYQHETPSNNNMSWSCKNGKSITNYNNMNTKINIYKNSLYQTEYLLQNRSHSNNSTPKNVIQTPPNSNNNKNDNNVNSSRNMMKNQNKDKDNFKPYNHNNIYVNNNTTTLKNTNKSVENSFFKTSSHGKANKYLNIAQFRKKNILSIEDQDQQYVNNNKNNLNGNTDKNNQLQISLSQINKISPYACMCFSIGRPIDMNNQSGKKQHKNNSKKNIKNQNKKQVIKQKIKDRVKAQIQNLIKRNTFKLKKIDPNDINIHHTNTYTYTYKFMQPSPKQALPCEDVTIIGQSLVKPIDCLTFYQKQRQRLAKSSYDQETQQIKLKSIRKSILLGQLGFKSRKVQSSLDYRLNTKQMERQKWRNKFQDQKLGIKYEANQRQRQNLFTPAQSYRRTMSTDIRIKNMSNRKASQSQYRNLHPKIKEDGLQPWIVSSFVDQQLNF